MNALSHSTNSENWEQTIANSGYTHQEVDRYMKESYQKGYNDKDDEIRAKISEIFVSNQEATDRITQELYDFLKSIDIIPLNAYLKVGSIFNFSIIVVVSLNDYVSDNLLKAYSWTNETEKVSRNANFNIEISFMYGDENLSIESLNSDGYRYKHKSSSGN